MLSLSLSLSLSLFTHTHTHKHTHSNYSNYAVDILWKDVFCLAFCSEWKNLLVVDNNLSGTICLFCFRALFSNIYHKIDCIDNKMGLIYAISIVNRKFGIFYEKQICFAFLNRF